MADDVSQPIITTTKYWEFHHPSSHCQSSTNAIPWLICIIALTAAWTFLLGATDIRRRLRNRYGRFAEPWGFSPQIVAIFGSLFLQLAMTLAMAQILRGPPHPATSRNSFGMALGVWMIRPLPACVVSVISFMSLSTYQANAMEIQATELLYGLGAGYFYVDINRKVQVASAVLKQPQVSGAAAAPTVTNTHISYYIARRTGSLSRPYMRKQRQIHLLRIFLGKLLQRLRVLRERERRACGVGSGASVVKVANRSLGSAP